MRWRHSGSRAAGWSPVPGSSGYTLIELIVVLILFSIVMAAISLVLLAQRRFYTSQTRIADTRDAIRIAADVLSGELREVSPGGGDLYAIAPDSIAFRSHQGFGVICEIAEDRIRIWMSAGTFGDSDEDSVLVFVEKSFDTAADDGWVASHIEAVRDGGAAPCPNGRVPDLELVASDDLSAAGATPGSPVRAFRPQVYRLYAGSDGRWWLGQRVRGDNIQPVAGPFASPEDGGLRFEYFAANGTDTVVPGRVGSIGITIKSRSTGPIPRSGGIDFYSDTLSVVVYLRNR